MPRNRHRAAGDDAARAMNALRRIVRALQSAARSRHGKAGRPGVSGAQHFVLRQLAERPGLSLSELAARTLARPSTLSEVVGRLVDAGLVRRASARADGRRLELTVTPRGAAAARAGGPGVPQRLAAALDRLTPARRSALAAALEAWVAAAGLGRTPATMFLEAAAGNGPRPARRRSGAS